MLTFHRSTRVHGSAAVGSLESSAQGSILEDWKLRLYISFKRLVDTIMIVILSPLILLPFLLVAGLILICMGRPVIYRQKRYGLNGKKITILKFRTMVNGQDTKETIANDERITKLGKILRKLRLDEIPQFINVLRGDMSVIGPRPEWTKTADEFAKHIPQYHLRHQVRPGITGLAQVKQGHAVGVAENYRKYKLDLEYIDKLSPFIDLKIVLSTIRIVLMGCGAK